jgi:CRISPR-associated protein Csb2
LIHRRSSIRKYRPSVFVEHTPVHYLWNIQQDDPAPLDELTHVTHQLGSLGWSTDFAYAEAKFVPADDVGKLPGIRWTPRADIAANDRSSRIPKQHSLADLQATYKKNIMRNAHFSARRGTVKPKVFDRIFYANSEYSIGRPHKVFALRTRKGESFSYPQAKLIHIAGMTRSAAIKRMKEYPPEDLEKEKSAAWVEYCVAGHRPEGEEEHRQFSYVPLPSIGHEHADAAIRRVMIIAPFGDDAHLHHLAEQLDGEQLTPEGGGERPILDHLSSDGVTRQYLDSSTNWASVTPVILPGHDDHKAAKTEKLIQKALIQSGVDQPCKFTWGAVPNFPNCLSAHKYDRNKRFIGYYRPNHLEALTAVHIRIKFEHPFTGPLCIGAGRHCGLGVFAVVP